jgi:hypothetical protein
LEVWGVGVEGFGVWHDREGARGLQPSPPLHQAHRYTSHLSPTQFGLLIISFEDRSPGQIHGPSVPFPDVYDPVSGFVPADSGFSFFFEWGAEERNGLKLPASIP